MSPVLDDRGRLFGLINLVDLLVIVLLVVLVGLAVVRLSRPEGKETSVRSTFKVEHVQQPTVNKVKVGQQVEDDTGNVLGTVVATTVEASLEEWPNPPKSRLESGPSPIFRDLLVDVKGQGHASREQIKVGNLVLEVGDIVTIKGPGWKVKASVWDAKAAQR
jgi:Domain of unknown function (DUF4330)